MPPFQPAASDDARVDAAKEETKRLVGQYRSELVERWVRAGLPLQLSLGALEASMTEEQEEAGAKIPRIWVDYEEESAEEDSEEDSVEDSEEEEDWGAAVGVPKWYSGVSPPSPPPLNAITAMQDMCCR